MAIFHWMNIHLKNNTGLVTDAANPPIDGKRLCVFPEDKDLPGDSRNSRIDELFVSKACASPAPADWPRWKADRLAGLRAVSFRTFPDRVAAAEPRLRGGLGKHQRRWLGTEPGIDVAIADLRQPGNLDRGGTLIVLELRVKNWMPCRAGRLIVASGDVVILAPRGVGPTAWDRESPPDDVERAHVLLGRTVDEGKVWHVAAPCGGAALSTGTRTHGESGYGAGRRIAAAWRDFRAVRGRGRGREPSPEPS